MPQKKMREVTPLLYETSDIASASYLTYVLGLPQLITFDPKTSRVVFSFEDRIKAIQALVEYESCAVCPAKPLMATRAYLYREVTRVSGEHRRGR